MKDLEERKAAKEFAKFWEGKGYEKGESQPFWMSLLREVLGVTSPETLITFENQVHLDNTSFIDGWIPTTHVLIEQKSIDKDLRKGIRQSDGSVLTPFQQAKRYAAELPYSERPRWIVTSNFKEFLVYDMERPNSEPETIMLENLEKEYYRLKFLVDSGDENIRKEMDLSLKAGELVGRLYDLLLKQYDTPDDENTLKSLNALCVRLVFCFYAEDAGIFGKRDAFHDYVATFNPQNVRAGLIELFKTLDTKIEDRDKYMNPNLLAFPYVNGGLFADEGIEIPRFTPEIIQLMQQDCSLDFDWSGISPTIFGAVFESTLNPETRRSGGMHYTSIENIHKVIDPLLLDQLKQDLAEIESIGVKRTREQKLRDFQDRLASLKFLDPACGSGNFLTETFLSLRRLENEVLKSLRSDTQLTIGSEFSPIKVNIQQFYGIEINDFAVTVAKTALWIAESQMMRETEDIVGSEIDFLPLKTYTNIHEANALTLDWKEVIAPEKLSYIMGNPPFVGASMMTSEQKKEAVNIFGKIRLSNSIDFVGAWYHKAAELMQGTKIRAALVSTNSITQGEQVYPLWNTLIERYNIHIDFAYRTFRWDSEAKIKAHVHCVIIGFSIANSFKKPFIYNDNIKIEVNNINPYLIDAPNIFISSRSKPLCDVPPIFLGNKPTDGGNLIITEKEKDEIIIREPNLKQYIHPYIGSEEFINKKQRYCFWLVNITPTEIRNSAELYRRITLIKKFREESSAAPTREKSKIPHLFFFISQPSNNYILIPGTSSENRRYIPIGFMSPDVISSNSVSIIPNASLYNFGILTSNVHMAWMRAVCGRLEMRYRYSNSVVYNNFPWPTTDAEQRGKIEKTAQGILDARTLYADSSLADLYDEVTMPPELRKAHQENDRAVMEAYGFAVKDFTESDCVAALMKMYEKMSE